MMPTIDPDEIIEQSRAILEELLLLGIEQIPKSDELSLPLCPIGQSIDGSGGTKTRCRRETLDEILADIKDCTRCRLNTSRQNIVFGNGNPNADLFLIGEFPDHTEDLQGQPFLGDVGQLLDRIIFAMSLSREAVYTTNVVKCLPPTGTSPTNDDISTCFNLLERQINAVNPKVIVIFGETAAQSLLNIDLPISRIRGQWQEYNGIAVMPTYHPAYLLEKPGAKRDVWEDMKRVIDRLNTND